ncbi:FecR family protein [Flavobacteriaceae bacterium MHTCC 0001]
MKYTDFKEEDFIKDEYFQKWVLNPDQMTSNFWNNWLIQHPEKRSVIYNATNFVKLLNKNDKKLPEKDFDDMWQYIIQNRAQTKKISKALFLKNENFLLFQRVAAVLVIAITIGYVFKTSVLLKTNELENIDVEPRVTLEMDDGTIKFLDEISTEVLTDKKGETVVSKNKTQLSYSGNKGVQTLAYNVLTVPFGKKFELILSDGSHIYLNSGSKLRYPIEFLKDKPRDVFLDGEAYFEVAKDKGSAFTVITDDMNTQVYGTAFNVSSYKNENNTSTVLVEGSVGVYKSNNDEAETPIIIKPGKRAVLENGLIAVSEVNVSKYTAWKDGKLVFINDRFDLIVKELERHFNVVINNQISALNEKTFTGTFTTETLENILTVFKEHSGFDFSIEGNVYNINSNN